MPKPSLKGALDIPLCVGFTLRLSLCGHSGCRIKQRALRHRRGADRFKQICAPFSPGWRMASSEIKKRRTEERKPWRGATRMLAIPTTLNPIEHANPDLSQIGVVVYDDGLVADALIARCATGLAASGYRLVGVVQSNPPRL